jgi:uncharacterized membrane-anchored protein YjiN (DUF445 family)
MGLREMVKMTKMTRIRRKVQKRAKKRIQKEVVVQENFAKILQVKRKMKSMKIQKRIKKKMITEINNKKIQIKVMRILLNYLITRKKTQIKTRKKMMVIRRMIKVKKMISSPKMNQLSRSKCHQHLPIKHLLRMDFSGLLLRDFLDMPSKSCRCIDTTFLAREFGIIL